MAVTTVDTARPVTGGVDTHLEVNVAAALDGIGGLLGWSSFRPRRRANRQLLGCLAGFGPVVRVGVEGTGSYGGQPGPLPAPGGGGRWWRWTAPTAKSVAAKARPTPWTPSRPPMPPRGTASWGKPSTATATWKRSGR